MTVPARVYHLNEYRKPGALVQYRRELRSGIVHSRRQHRRKPDAKGRTLKRPCFALDGKRFELLQMYFVAQGARSADSTCFDPNMLPKAKYRRGLRSVGWDDSLKLLKSHAPAPEAAHIV